MILEALLGVSFLLVNTIYIFIVKSSLLNDERFYLMARVILYISNDVYDKVNAIVEQRRQEGARDKDISLSGTASMLLELGLRVYEAQMERKESAFNQTEFNKLLLECVSLSVLMSPEIQSLNMPIWLKISGRRYHLRWNDFFQKMMMNKRNLTSFKYQSFYDLKR